MLALQELHLNDNLNLNNLPVELSLCKTLQILPLENCPLREIERDIVEDREYDDVEMLPGTRLRNTEYVDDIAPIYWGLRYTQNTFYRLERYACQFNMAFVPTQCKLLLQGWLHCAFTLLGS
ncbi:uncharacterized protein DEA37_0012601, partial [Paragonimus westermani]